MHTDIVVVECLLCMPGLLLVAVELHWTYVIRYRCAAERLHVSMLFRRARGEEFLHSVQSRKGMHELLRCELPTIVGTEHQALRVPAIDSVRHAVVDGIALSHVPGENSK